MKHRMARDVMNTNVHTIGDEQLVVELAKLLSEQKITGVAVVNDKNRLVGVVSASDIVSHELKVGHKVVSETDYYAQPDLMTRKEMANLGMHIEDYNDLLVREIMTPVVNAVRNSVEPAIPEGYVPEATPPALRFLGLQGGTA